MEHSSLVSLFLRVLPYLDVLYTTQASCVSSCKPANLDIEYRTFML